MMDPYQVLGVRHDASQNDIKMAYRNLAKELHPDRHPGDARAAERFKEVSSAYQVLGDTKTRGRYDCGEIDASGNERVQRHRAYAHAGAGKRAQTNSFEKFGFGGLNVDDIFSPLFGAHRQSRRESVHARGKDHRYTIKISFLEAAKGNSRRLTLIDGKSFNVTIPAGIDDGQTIRLKGKGGSNSANGSKGDALIQVRVAPHPTFKRDGDDIYVELPVTLHEALMGARIEVPTIDGPVTMLIPKDSNTGNKLRLKSKGIISSKTSQRGDQYLILAVMLPSTADKELSEFLDKWHPDSYVVRGKFNL